MSTPSNSSLWKNPLRLIPRTGSRGEWMFLGLLLSLAFMFLIYPWFHEFSYGPQLFLVIKIFIAIACGRLILQERGQVMTFIILGIPMFAYGLCELVFPQTMQGPIVAVGHFFTLLFMLSMVQIILRLIYREPAVSLDTLFGGVCGFVLLSIAFAHSYSVMEALVPGSFKLIDGPSDTHWDPKRDSFEGLLYSLLTLTTVSGDGIAPVTKTARAMAAIEGVVGQFYMAIIVADLVGKRLSAVMAPSDNDPTKTPAA